MASALRNGRLDASDVPPIRLFEKDGNLLTLDNRRLEAFRRAEIDVPYRMTTPGEVSAESWKVTTKNQGASVRVRGE